MESGISQQNIKNLGKKTFAHESPENVLKSLYQDSK